MGYDLHITRRTHWSDSGPDIRVEEWIRLVAGSPDLRLAPEHGPYVALWSGPSSLSEPWLDWENGCIFSKNPDEALIQRMVQIAAELGAHVQGDDGEVYGSEENAQDRRPSLLDLLRAGARRLLGAPQRSRSAAPFKVGDRVRDPWGREGVVLEIDPLAQHGLGQIAVRYTSGRVLTSAFRAHGLTLVEGRTDSPRE